MVEVIGILEDIGSDDGNGKKSIVVLVMIDSKRGVLVLVCYIPE